MTNEDINKKVKLVVNSIEFIEDEDYEYLHKEGVEIEIKKCFEEIETLRTQLAKANERISQYESKQDDEAGLLIKLAKTNASAVSLELELAKANERVRELEVENSIIANSPDFTFDAVKDFFRQELNKFAIEKKIEALTSLIEHEASTFRLHNGNKRSAVFSIDIKHEIEALKLRKEQE